MKATFSFLLIFSITLSITLSAQDINYDNIILPNNIDNISVDEKLVKLAWMNHPENRQLQNNTEIMKLQESKTKGEWLNAIYLQGNVNESVIDDNASEFNSSIFYPMYNLSIAIPLGIFVNQPKAGQIANIQYQNAVQEVNNKKIATREKVLKSYQNYLLTKNLLTIQTEVTENAYNSFLIIEEQFKNGENSLQEYNAAFNLYKKEEANQLIAQQKFEVAKITIEAQIGMDLDLIIEEN